MADLIAIGRFAHLTGLSIKALHIYDSMGLLRPHVVDPDSGYRYYHITQLTLARRIRLLRAVDMPLEAIRGVGYLSGSRGRGACQDPLLQPAGGGPVLV